MRIKLTISQLGKLLETECLKLPVTFEIKNFTDKELLDLSKIVQKNEC